MGAAVGAADEEQYEQTSRRAVDQRNFGVRARATLSTDLLSSQSTKARRRREKYVNFSKDQIAGQRSAIWNFP